MKEIAFITDTHIDEELPKENGVDTRKNFEIILADVTSRNITEIIFGGDIGELSSNLWFFERLRKFELKIILGNHDKVSETRKHFESKLLTTKSEWYYAIENEFFKQIFLDTSSESISEAQFEWFQKEIKTGKKLLIFIHHPILEIDSVVDKLYPLEGRNKLKDKLLQLENQVLIFCGHCHTIDERVEKNITQIMTLAASFQVDKNAPKLKIQAEQFGYRVLRIENNKVETEVVIIG